MAKIELDDTIAAIATPLGEGGLAVIRVSGLGAFEAVQPFFHFSGDRKISDFDANTIHWGKFVSSGGQVVDQVLLSIFKAPHSYTGQDVMEISCHGGLAVTKRILNILLENGVRAAEPGEFTRRAFLNGKLDLTQAEAVLDLIRAKSGRSLDIAVRQLSGSLSRSIKVLKDDLLKLLAYLEASLDFPEEDLGKETESIVRGQFSSLQERLNGLIGGFERNLLIREGVLVTIVGKPNVGKSSLFNALLERDRALVSDIPHTTRDHLEESLEIQGFYIRLRDTAGLVSTPEHPLDKLGMEKTLQAIQDSHVILFVLDGSLSLEETDRHVLEIIPKEKNMIVLMNKSDLPMKIDKGVLENLTGQCDAIRVSTKTREGFRELEQRMAGLLERETSEEGEQVTRLRHKVAVETALKAVGRAQDSFEAKMSFEFVVLELKTALEALKELTGEIYSEDLLDVIFSEFCIGK